MSDWEGHGAWQGLRVVGHVLLLIKLLLLQAAAALPQSSRASLTSLSKFPDKSLFRQSPPTQRVVGNTPQANHSPLKSAVMYVDISVLLALTGPLGFVMCCHGLEGSYQHLDSSEDM